jgi:hypothetical protein
MRADSTILRTSAGCRPCQSLLIYQRGAPLGVVGIEHQESCMDVYGPRPIATAGLIGIDGHNC